VKICVDAGHGGSDPGAVGTAPYRLEEKRVTLEIALTLEAELADREHGVVMTRRRDRTVGLVPRARFANRLKADLFVSIHANAALSAAVEGMEVYHFPGSAGGRRAATAVLESMVTAFPGHRNRGLKEANFAVLRETRMPAILIETEFITSPRQLVFLSDPEQQEALVEAIADGIDDLGGRGPRPSSSTPRSAQTTTRSPTRRPHSPPTGARGA